MRCLTTEYITCRHAVASTAYGRARAGGLYRGYSPSLAQGVGVWACV